MRRILFLWAFWAIAVPAVAQAVAPTEKPIFKNQGEQEDYNAAVFFKENYAAKSYTRYVGTIPEIDRNTLQYGDRILVLDNMSPQLKPVFTKGILYPQIIGTTVSFISSFEELKFLRLSPQVRRFRFWAYHKNVKNPTVYLLEITNTQATEKTGMESFIANGTLTFLKKGWMVL